MPACSVDEKGTGGTRLLDSKGPEVEGLEQGYRKWVDTAQGIYAEWVYWISFP